MKEVRLIPLSQLKDNPYQPRLVVDIESENIADLANSIKENGLLQPILVSEDKSDGKFFIIFGHRRAMAYRRLGREAIEARVANFDGASEQSRMHALVENVQRKDLNPIETGMAYRDAIDSGIRIADLCKSLGKRPSDISKALKMITLCVDIQAHLSKNKNAKKDETILYELANCVKDEAKQFELYMEYQNGSPRLEMIAKIKAFKPGKSKQKNLNENMRIAYDNQGIKLRAPFLVTLGNDKKKELEQELLALFKKYQY